MCCTLAGHYAHPEPRIAEWPEQKCPLAPCMSTAIVSSAIRCIAPLRVNCELDLEFNEMDRRYRYLNPNVHARFVSVPASAAMAQSIAINHRTVDCAALFRGIGPSLDPLRFVPQIHSTARMHLHAHRGGKLSTYVRYRDYITTSALGKRLEVRNDNLNSLCKL